MNNPKILHRGSTGRERQDRATGALMTVLGLYAILQLPEARYAALTIQGNGLDPQVIYLCWFAASLCALVGPCIMLPHRAGALPLIMAFAFSVMLFQAEVDHLNHEKGSDARAAATQALPASERGGPTRAFGG